MPDDLDWDKEVKPMLEAARANCDAGNDNWVKASYRAANYFLNVVPPAAYFKTGWACGEAHHHNDQGVPVHLCFRRCSFSSDTAEARYCTLKEFRENP